LREAKLQATDYLILLIAGACLGAISKISDSNFGASGYTYTIIAICKLRTIPKMSTLGITRISITLSLLDSNGMQCSKTELGSCDYLRHLYFVYYTITSLDLRQTYHVSRKHGMTLRPRK